MRARGSGAQNEGGIQDKYWREKWQHLGTDMQSFIEILFRKRKQKKTYNSGDSLVVTHPTTNPPI